MYYRRRPWRAFQIERGSLPATRRVIHRREKVPSKLTRVCENPCNTALFPPVIGAQAYEAHLSTLENPPRPYPRFSGTHENSWRSGRDQRATGKRTGTSGGLKPARQKLPRKARLCGKAQFTGAFTARRQGDFFVVSRRNNAPGAQSRLGIVVGRQVAPRAATRSMMKRIVREVFRRLRDQLGSVDIVVRVRPGPAPFDRSAARRELEKLLRETC